MSKSFLKRHDTYCSKHTTKPSVESNGEAAIVLIEGNRKRHRPRRIVNCWPSVHGRCFDKIMAVDGQGE